MMVTNLRPELTRHLFQRLQAFQEGFQHNLALIGPPGSGKTFQLQYLLGQHASELLFVYCPLYQESARSVLHRLLCAIVQAGLPAPRAAGNFELEFRVHSQANQLVGLEALLEESAPSLPRTTAAIRGMEGLLGRRLYGEAFSRTLDVIPVLGEECRRPCVLVLDEFLFLEACGLTHAFRELGKRVMTWPSTLFILSSSAVFNAQAILRERLQLLFGQFELLTLDGLDAQVASRWVQHELADAEGADETEAVRIFLLHWLGAYPWYLTVFLKRLKKLVALRQGQGRCAMEGLFLEAAWDVLGSPEGTLQQWCLSRIEGLTSLRIGRRALEMLAQVAEGGRTATAIGRCLGRAGLSAGLQLLLERDLVQRSGACWMVTDPILRCWLMTMFASQRSGVRLDGTEVRRRFDEHLRALWTMWLHTHQLSFPEQIEGLFGRFCDETVSLDSKMGRLPRFHAIQRCSSLPGTSAAETYLIADAKGTRWCATVHEGAVDETAITAFDTFCRTQHPKPSRKIVVSRTGLNENATLVAKAANMWVWEPDDLTILRELYGQGSLPSGTPS